MRWEEADDVAEEGTMADGLRRIFSIPQSTHLEDGRFDSASLGDEIPVGWPTSACRPVPPRDRGPAYGFLPAGQVISEFLPPMANTVGAGCLLAQA